MKKIFLTETVKYVLMIGISTICLVWAVSYQSIMNNLSSTLDSYLHSSMIKVDHDLELYNKLLDEYKQASLVKASSIALILKADPSFLENKSKFDSLRKTFGVNEIVVTGENGMITAFSSDKSDNITRKDMLKDLILSLPKDDDLLLYQEPAFCDRNKGIYQYTFVARKDDKGFIMIGKSGKTIQDILDFTTIEDVANLYPIYENGFIAIVDKNTNIIESFKDDKYLDQKLSDLDINIKSILNAKGISTVKIDGKKAFVIAKPHAQYYFLAFAFYDDVYYHMYLYLSIIIFAILFMLIVLNIYMLQIVKLHIIDGVEYIINCLDSIKKDNLNVCVDLRTCKEFETLSDSINAMVARLYTLLISEQILVKEKENIASAKGNFLAMMSHEIRTPLNIIMGMTQSGLADTMDADKMREAFSDINAASSHLLSLLNDILDMSKIDAGKMEILAEPFSIKEDMEHLSVIMQSKAQEKDIKLTINYDNLDDIIIIGDKLRLNQVLINLLSNSFKFTERFKQVSLNIDVLESNDDNILIRFAVEDQGIGMSNKQIATVFRPFEQADISITRGFGGIGLGLTISKNLVELMGGSINVTSKIGEGSRFWFDIPFKKGVSNVSSDEKPYIIEDNSLINYRVLIVDDEPLNRKVMSMFLQRTGVKMEEAENGQKAFDMYLENQAGYYDMIFMDIHMPEMDGFKTTESIRSSDKIDALTIPIIAVTADAFKDNQERVKLSGMNAFIAKPVKFDTLSHTIKDILDNKMSSNEQMMIWTKIQNLD